MPAALSMQEPSWTLVDSMSMAALGPKYSITAYVLCVRRAVFLRTALEVNVSSEILTMSLDHVHTSTAAARVSELRVNLANTPQTYEYRWTRLVSQSTSSSGL